MKAAPVSFTWDYFLEGHTAGGNGAVDAAIAAYQKALRVDGKEHHIYAIALSAENCST